MKRALGSCYELAAQAALAQAGDYRLAPRQVAADVWLAGRGQCGFRAGHTAATSSTPPLSIRVTAWW
ncbi:hypothetical protein ACU4GD_10150 [Cupriavidus basilensis]